MTRVTSTRAVHSCAAALLRSLKPIRLSVVGGTVNKSTNDCQVFCAHTFFNAQVIHAEWHHSMAQCSHGACGSTSTNYAALHACIVRDDRKNNSALRKRLGLQC